MNEKEYYPKNGLFAKCEKLPKLGGFSLSAGLAKEPVCHCMDGYDKPITHEGYEIYLYISLFNCQITVGYKHVKKVSA